MIGLPTLIEPCELLSVSMKSSGMAQSRTYKNKHSLCMDFLNGVK
ncbi:hypothetical protein ATJ93_4251 [Halopiger aswanensis]|uniref:Uncharacterized protein n=1 Tax=Halopiger aswanensis TaxID=148449 RepID=A0A3R7HFZ6_9EURY|nr:hypothetical protein ATJ93_4251 [Halopiger aswanensis]